ncbi:MAG TPA: HAD family hydrolase [Thermoanaerobaculia bacterium]|jgi:phosphoglycolate phosphatase-like HAD superfamily hydrolase
MADPLVIFDVDGTLCDTCHVDDVGFCEVAAEMLGVPVPSESWKAAPEITDAGILAWLWDRHLGRRPTRQELDTFVAAFETVLARELQRGSGGALAMPGVARLLERLAGTGWDVAFATGGWGRTARLKLRLAGLPVEPLLASSDDSPDRVEIFRLAGSRAAERAGAPHARRVLVGDGLWDVRVAARLGWPVLGVGRGEHAGRLREEGASAVVADFQDVEAVLGLLRQAGGS